MKHLKRFNESFNDQIEVFKKTDDDWHGNYGENKDEVKLTYHGLINSFEEKSNWTWRVSVWSNDDTAMYKDFDNEKDAKILFEKLNEKNKINFSDCKNLGMNWFG